MNIGCISYGSANNMSTVLLWETTNYLPLIFKCTECSLCLKFEELVSHYHIRVADQMLEKIEIHSEFSKYLEKIVVKRVNCFRILEEIIKSFKREISSESSTRAEKLIQKLKKNRGLHEKILEKLTFSFEFIKVIQKKVLTSNLSIKYSTFEDSERFFSQEFLFKSVKPITNTIDLLKYSDQVRGLNLIPKKISADNILFAFKSFYVIDLANCIMIFDTSSSSIHSIIYYRLNKIIISTNNFSKLVFITIENFLVIWDVEARFTIFKIQFDESLLLRGLSLSSDENHVIFADNHNTIFIVNLITKSYEMNMIFKQKCNFGFLMLSDLKNILVIHNNEIFLCDLRKAKILLKFNVKQKISHEVIFLIDDDHLLFKDKNSINMFSFKKQKVIKSFETSATSFYLNSNKTCVITSENQIFDTNYFKKINHQDLEYDEKQLESINFRRFGFQFHDIYSSEIFTYTKVAPEIITHSYSNYENAVLVYKNKRISIFNYKTKEYKEFNLSYYQFNHINFSKNLDYLYLSDEANDDILAWNIEKASFEYFYSSLGQYSASQLKVISRKNLLIIENNSFLLIYKDLPKYLMNFSNNDVFSAICEKTSKPILIYRFSNSIYQIKINDFTNIYCKICDVPNKSMVHFYYSHDKLVVATLQKIFILSSNFENKTKTIDNVFNSVDNLTFLSNDLHCALSKDSNLIIINYSSNPSIIKFVLKNQDGKLFNFTICKEGLIILSFLLEDIDGFYHLYDEIYTNKKIMSGKHHYFIPNSLNFDFYYRRNSHFIYSFMMKVNQDIRNCYLSDTSNSKNLFYIIYSKFIVKVKLEAIEIFSMKGNFYMINLDSTHHQNINSLAKSLILDILNDQIFVLDLLNIKLQIHSIEKKSHVLTSELNPINYTEFTLVSISRVIFLPKCSKIIFECKNNLKILNNYLETWYFFHDADSFFVSKDEKFVIVVCGFEIFLCLLKKSEMIRLRNNDSVWKVIWIDVRKKHDDYKAYFLADCLVEEIIIPYELIDRTR